ncbi:TylF/MycF family methyltransferase [Nitratireductor kimnyeongensis]|uniref:TylF/MycF family methyltransferase n=1 Tax=Nitratireductor kimnyeongensis TaxID=430679 RepID=A0ABW0T648_9HYPH|nr:TylF/MycF family methyltransferase [Nitratireductor kimnyeongensis]QZZ34886.1 TylF/MycF family methyltransferase [Nitratireductor kimnyeongensis]
MFQKLGRSIAKRRLILSLPPVARDVMKDGLTYLPLERMASLNAELERMVAQDVPGDIAEFGMALGGSAIVLAKSRGKRRFLGFDVFGRIPPPTDDDGADAHSRFKVIAEGKSTGIRDGEYYGYVDDLFGRVVSSFEKYGLRVDNQSIILRKGLFQETFSPSESDRFRLVHIDCDWYDPVFFCLTSVSRCMSPGGVVIVDDYNDYEGCRNAVDKVLAEDASLLLERTLPHAVIRKRAS